MIGDRHAVLGGNRAWLSVALAFVLLVTAWFSPWWLLGRYFAPLDILNQMLPPWNEGVTYPNVHNHYVSDAVTQYIPYHMLAERSLKQDGYIGWNPYSETGTRLDANTMALPGDWSLQLYRWFDFWTGWHLGLIGHFLIAGLGMLVFLRSKGCMPWAALAGAIVFTANGQFAVWFFHRWALACFCWMPWVLWALCKFVTAYKKNTKALVLLGWFFISSGFLALAFLGGTLQHAVYVVVAVVCFWMAEVILPKNCPKIMLTLVLVGVGLLGFLLASGTLVPCAEAFFASRAAGDRRGGFGYKQGLLQPILYASAYLFNVYPSILGSPQTFDGWKVFKCDYFQTAYLSTLATALSFLALFRKSAPLTARCLIATGLLIPLTPLVGFLYHRVLLLFALGGAWVLADFLTSASEPLRIRFARAGLRLATATVLVWTVASLLLVFFDTRLKAFTLSYLDGRVAGRQFGMYKAWFLDRASHYIDSLCIWNVEQWPLVLLAVLGLLILRRGSSIQPVLLQASLCVLLAAELTILGGRAVTTVNPSQHPPYKETPAIAAVREAVGTGRLFQDTVQRYISQVPISPNLPSLFGIRHLSTYESIRPAGLWGEKGYNTHVNGLIELGVTHLLQSSEYPTPEGWRLLWTKGKMQLFEACANAEPLFTKTLEGRQSVTQPYISTMNVDSFKLMSGEVLQSPLETPGRCTKSFGESTIQVIYKPSPLLFFPPLLACTALVLGSALLRFSRGRG